MRLLKSLVIVMGVVLVVAFGALIIIVINRMNAPRPEAAQTMNVPQPKPAAPAAPVATEPATPAPRLGQALPPQFAPSFGEQPLKLPAGARLSDFSAGGDRLVLRIVLADQSQQLMVVDLNTGVLIGTLKLETADQGGAGPAMPLLPSVMVPPRNAQEGKK